MIKLVNYIRAQVQQGSSNPDVSDPANWQDDKFMQPVLENDALLFGLDELDAMDAGPNDQASKQPANDASAEVARLKEQLSRLQFQFDAYRGQVSQTLEQRWADNEARTSNTTEAAEKKYDEGYFDSYSYNDIHQTMLQDTVRTDAYRDFIYDNKHLFKDKVVLDVGCGTGILSMLSAKAGAKHVFAIDNSAIIDKARQIASDNGLLSQISFVRGKVEDLHELPGGVKEVDIIVSEWMGYCLFFENMLPSVLSARDRFMKRRADGSFDGLMVPSHCSVQLAPMADPDWIADNVTFWKDVYGFDMRCMKEGALEEVVVQHPPAETIVGRTEEKRPVALWDLYEANAADLFFTVPFDAKLEKYIDALDAWCTWFDIVFSPKPAAAKGASSARIDPAEQEKLAKDRGAVQFTTSPMTKRTHWQSGVCVIERKGTTGNALSEGSSLSGNLKFSQGKEARAIDIQVDWDSKDGKEKGTQMWRLR